MPVQKKSGNLLKAPHTHIYIYIYILNAPRIYICYILSCGREMRMVAKQRTYRYSQ